MSTQAFGPRGVTYNIACTDVSSTAINIVSDTFCFTYQFVNIGTNIAYFAVGTDNTVVAKVPTAATPALGVPVLPNEIVVYSFTPSAWIAAICSTGLTTNLLVTVGEGM